MNKNCCAVLFCVLIRGRIVYLLCCCVGQKFIYCLCIYSYSAG
jgi:hypothetical protein